MLKHKMDIRKTTPPAMPAVRVQPAGGPQQRAAILPTTAAIPDIHGHSVALHRVVSHLKNRPVERVFLGDFFDRGYGNRAAYDILRGEKRLLMGNHAIFQLLAVKGDLWGLTKWLGNGAQPFLEECGINYKPVRETVDKLLMRYTFLGGNTEDVFVQMQVDYPAVLEKVSSEITANPVLREICSWLLECTKIYHVDSNGVLYIHGGVPETEIQPGLFERLDAIHRQFRDLLSTPSPDLFRLRQLRTILLNFLAARGDEFLAPIAKRGDEAVSRYLRQLGVTGMVCAHTIKSKVEVTAGRVFEIDLGMNASNQGSFVTLGQDGVISFREAGLAGFTEEVLVKPAEWLT